MKESFGQTQKLGCRLLPWACTSGPTVLGRLESRHAQLPLGTPLFAFVIMKRLPVTASWLTPGARALWAMGCVPFMAVLERRKGSFSTALPESLPEASKATVESPKNHKQTLYPTSWRMDSAGQALREPRDRPWLSLSLPSAWASCPVQTQHQE